MKIQFWKMHGAANDFILVDDREETFPIHSREWIEQIASRRTGVGCEGVILIQPSTSADFRMRFLNPDGGEVDFCGNGARCIARLAYEIGAAPADMTFESRAGLIGATVRGSEVCVRMPEPKDWQLNDVLHLGNKEYTFHFVNTGVPHVVIPVENLDTVDVVATGRAIRHHKLFQPKGTNVNFLQVTGPSSIRVRTYERGVEAETLACGTGMVACAVIAGHIGLVQRPVQLTPASGDLVTVDFMQSESSVSGVTMTGPTEHVFDGFLDYSAD